MDIQQLFRHYEETIAAQARAAGIFEHRGDRGEAREDKIREFLRQHLPKKYGVTSGEIVTRTFSHSHAADVIIYDALNCPVLYVGENSVLPIEGVYGIIEVKSSLSKATLQDAVKKIASFKRLAPRELSIVHTRTSVLLQRPSRPFGIVLGLQLADNSLESLSDNLAELQEELCEVDLFTNIVAVLGAGLLFNAKIHSSSGAVGRLLHTDEFVELVQAAEQGSASSESMPDVDVGIGLEPSGSVTFGRFLVYLLLMLERLKLSIPDLEQYLVSDIVDRES